MIKEFQGEYRFLSNFWPSNIEFEGDIYPSVEHAYQRAKSNDPDWKQMVLNTPNPGIVKKLYRKQKIRKDWNDIKLGVMEDLLRNKFTKNKTLKDLLLKTANEELQEGNYWHDKFWGIDLSTGEGENNLGKLLMKIRGELKNTNENRKMDFFD